MNRKSRFKNFVIVHSIVANEFFNNTDVPLSGMSGEEVDKKLNYFAEQVCLEGKITRTERDYYLIRHSFLGIGKSKGIPPRTEGKPILEINYPESLLEENHG